MFCAPLAVLMCILYFNRVIAVLSFPIRFESQLADEEASMQQRTRRLYSELQEEKEKCTAEQHQLALQFQEKEKLLKVGIVCVRACVPACVYHYW